MSSRLKTEEILDFAISVEKKGYEFYTENAKTSDDLELVKLFHLLAEQELKHETLFKKMKEDLADSPEDDAGGDRNQKQLQHFLKAVISGESSIFKGKTGQAQSVDDLLRTAMGIEKDSVVFYTALKSYLDSQHHGVLEGIIREEVHHILEIHHYKTHEVPPTPDVDAL